MKLKHKILMLSVFGLCMAAVSAFGAGTTAYVINTSGETLDKISLSDGVVTKSVLTLGSDVGCFPNQIIVRDTMAYVLLSGTDEIQIINLRNETTVGWVDFPGGSNPFWMGFLDDRYLYVSLLVGDGLAKVDIDSRQVIKTTDIGPAPEGVLLVDGKVYVAVTAYDFNTYSWGQGRVAVYDAAGDTLIGDIPVGMNPQFLAMDRLGRVHVVCTGNYYDVPGIVYIIDSGSDAVADSVPLGGQPWQIAIGPNDIAVVAAGGWAADGVVFSYQALTGDIYHDTANPIYVDSGATGAVPYQDSTVFVATFGDRINRLNGAGEKLATYHMGDGPVHVDFDYHPGDADGDGTVNLGDAVHLINFIFKNGAPPGFPAWRGNPNGDAAINIGDPVYLINYIFRSGPPPLIGPTWMR